MLLSVPIFRASGNLMTGFEAQQHEYIRFQGFVT